MLKEQKYLLFNFKKTAVDKQPVFNGMYNGTQLTFNQW
jgi:hypothetical protein